MVQIGHQHRLLVPEIKLGSELQSHSLDQNSLECVDIAFSELVDEGHHFFEFLRVVAEETAVEFVVDGGEKGVGKLAVVAGVEDVLFLHLLGEVETFWEDFFGFFLGFGKENQGRKLIKIYYVK